MDLEFGQTGNVARISHISPDKRTAYFDFKNGSTANLTSDQILNLSVGDIILIPLDGKSYKKVANELWFEDPWIGVIKIHNDKSTIVDISGKFKEVDYPIGMDLRVGNTVKGYDSRIEEVLSEEPLRYIDLPSIDKQALRQFKPQAER